MSTGAFTLADIDKPAQQKGEFSVADIDQMPPAPTKTSLNASPKAFTLPWFKQEAVNFAEGATKSLPAIGATLGGLAGFAEGGPVGSVGGAGIGGMGGEAAKQLLRRGLFGDGPYSPDAAARDITKEGVIQGAVQAGTEAMPFLAAPLRRAAVTQYERALAPTTKINKAITQDIAPELIQRGERGSLEDLESRAGQKISELNPQLNSAYKQASLMPTSAVSLPAKVANAGNKVVNDLETLKQSYMPGGNVAQPQAVSAIEGVQNIVKQYGPDISPDHLRRLRQIFEEVPAQRGAYAGTDLSTNYTLNAQQQAADSIRGILNKNPDIGSLNKEISFWLDVQRVTSQSALRRTGQEGGLLKTLWPLGAAIAGGGAGFAAHGTEAGIGAAASTILATQAARAVRSPAWRTTSAVAKGQLANALARGNVGEVSALLGRLGIASAEPTQQTSPYDPPTQRLQQ